MLAHGRDELSPFCRMPSQSNKLYKPVPETSDHAEQGMSPFLRVRSLHKRRGHEVKEEKGLQLVLDLHPASEPSPRTL
jgi:hypothetical protein